MYGIFLQQNTSYCVIEFISYECFIQMSLIRIINNMELLWNKRLL